MPRDVDARKTRRVLARLARLKAKAADPQAEPLSEWEADFVASVEARIATFGSAFADPEKGDLSEPLSARQGVKLREIGKKADGKARKPMARGSGFKAKPGKGLKQTGFGRKAAARPGPRVRDINEDVIRAVEAPPPEPELESLPPPKRRPMLRLVRNDDSDA